MSFDGSTILTSNPRAFTADQIVDTFNVAGNDVDIISVELVAGHLYTLDVDNGNDSYMRIFDAFGNEVKAVDDDFAPGETRGLQPYAEFLAGSTGTYYIAFSAFYLTSYDPFTNTGRVSPENSLVGAVSDLIISDTGVHRFPVRNNIQAITAKDAADESDVIQDADGRIRVEYGSSNFLDSAEVDMGRFDLRKGDTIVVDVNGRVSANILDAVLRIFDRQGNQIAIDNGSGSAEDSELVFAAVKSGDFYIAVSGQGNDAYNALNGAGALAGDTGNYSVIVHRNPTMIGNFLINDMAGTAGADYIVSLAGADIVNGNDGNDTLAGGDNNDVLTGGRGDDTLYGEADGDTLNGSGGNDILLGGFGTDALNGGGGNDNLDGGAANDILMGGGGTDVLRGDEGGDTLNGDGGNDALAGGNGNDFLNGGKDNDVLNGDSGLDTLNGDDGNDQLFGGDHGDLLNGEEGEDRLDGGDGGDTLDGGAAGDRLHGGLGDDTLTGGGGDDIFDFDSVAEGLDTITAFELAGAEAIDLSAIFKAAGSVVTSANLSQFIQVTPAGAGADSFLGVDADGVSGGLTFTIIAQVNGISQSDLFNIDNFIV